MSQVQLEPFDDLEYTRKKIRQQLELIQEHCSDGSAFANCRCIQEKHLDMVDAYASEGSAITKDEKEKAFYAWLSPWCDATEKHVFDTLDANNDEKELEMWKTLADDVREIRKEVVQGSFTPPNPASKRAYLPHGLTEKEKEDGELRGLLSRCVKSVEKTQCPAGFHGDYSLCESNPVAVCRASVEH